MTLSYSRHLFCYPVLRMTQPEFLAAHVAAFAFFDGCPARLVPDNLGSGVLKADLYDPRLNRGYAELSYHYGCLVDPARAGCPKDKPRVERMVPYVRDSFFSGRQFSDLPTMRTQAASWSSAVAGQRAARPLGGAKPETVFRALEQEHLLPLPRRPFEAATWQTAKVASDCHVSVGGALYSVPFRLIGARLDVRFTEAMVFIYEDHEIVKSHARVRKGRRSTDWQDYPSAKAAFFMRNPSWCRRSAAELGPAVAALVTELLGEQALNRLRSAQGSSIWLIPTAPSASSSPAPWPSRSVTPATARCGASSRPVASSSLPRRRSRSPWPPPTCTDPSPYSPIWRLDHGDPSAGGQAQETAPLGDARHPGGAPRAGAKRRAWAPRGTRGAARRRDRPARGQGTRRTHPPGAL